MRADDAPGPFPLQDYSLTAMATGLTARTARELEDRLARAPARSLYHHFWGRLLRDDPAESDFGNDFAEWAAAGLHDMVLAERLALVDPLRHDGLEALRETVAGVLRVRTEERDGAPAACPPEDAFHFVVDQMVVYETGRSVARPEELRDRLDELTPEQLFLHFVRPPGRAADGARSAPGWIRAFGAEYEAAAAALEEMDVFLLDAAELRLRIRGVLVERLPVPH